MAKRKRKKNPALRWVLSLLAAAGGFQVGAFFGNDFAALLSAGVAFYLVWTASVEAALCSAKSLSFSCDVGASFAISMPCGVQ